jgi:hypothetical protein
VTELPPNDFIQASAARFLIDGGEQDAANVLLWCTLDVTVLSKDSDWDDSWPVRITFIAPRVAFDILEDEAHNTTRSIHRAIEAGAPSRILGEVVAHKGRANRHRT